MGLLTPNNSEIELLQRQFEEKCKMIGVEGLYYEVKDHKLTQLSTYDRMEYFDPVKIDFLFEEMPNPKTLKNLNWWDDSDDTVPPIAYLPWHIDQDRQYLLKPTIGSKLEIKDPLSGFTRAYEIQEINANTLYMTYSIVKLTPLREEKMVPPERAETMNIIGKKGTDYEYIHD